MSPALTHTRARSAGGSVWTLAGILGAMATIHADAKLLDGATHSDINEQPHTSTAQLARLDKGVIGMEAFRPSAPPMMESSKPKNHWGSESEQDKQAKARFIAEARKRVNDPYALVRSGIQLSLLGTLMHLAITAALKKTLPPQWARRVSTLLTLLMALRSFGAAPRSFPALEGEPPSYPFIGNLLDVIAHKDSFHNHSLYMLRKLNFQSQEVRIPGATMCVMMNPLDREYVLRTNWRHFLKNVEGNSGGVEGVAAEFLGRGIFATDEAEWQDSRKIASHLFSGNGLKHQMEAVFNKHAVLFVEALGRIALEGRVVDVQELFQAIIFDAFCEIAFGVFPDCTSAALGGVKPPFLVSFDYCQAFFGERVLKPPVEWQLSKLVGHVFGVGPDAEHARHLKVVDDYVYGVVRDRKKLGYVKERTDLLSLYINHAYETGQNHILDDAYLRDTVVNYMVAGRDTTSCTLTNMCRFLSENPAVVARLRETEFTKVSADGHISWEAAGELHLVHAVFNETIRLVPPVGDDFRIAICDEVLPSGLKVRAGTRMIVCNTAIGRDPNLWSEPDSFKPERWMTYDSAGKAQRVRRPDEFVMPVFWSGPRLCLGKDMARFESSVFCAKVFSKFNIESLPNQSEIWSSGPVIFYAKGWKTKVSPYKALP